MKKQALLLFCIYLCNIQLSLLFTQDVSAINRFQYINVPPLEYNILNPKTGNITTQYDIYGVREIIVKSLQSIGIEVLQYSDQQDDEMRNDCRIGHCEVFHTSELDPDIIDGIIISFSDCNYSRVYSSHAKVNSMSAKRVTTSIAEGKAHVQQATNTALSELSQFAYQYDVNNPIEKILMRTSEMDRKELIAHFKSEENTFDSIEGVYQSIDVDAYFVELAILKNGYNYDIIVLKSEDERWNSGQIRGVLGASENGICSGFYYYTKDYKLLLEIKNSNNKYYIFSFIDSSTDEYFTIEFKKKLP